ncbi:hypothetical protein [Mycolicibacterium holsaticum]|uniref:hypothetical protein n=1 Tax=Mycolicibacterium holsaticum TaxID=152142 RepID=UPI001C7E1370|nr:hypothetical protein [Mycolicibacterium holsaticum]MDA4107531.1 hypothetical protein [Mycolicibacterium holsaticum DSM 44478 = JCM 12374]QZA11263.1 hypothetical protein K3U96_18780 [Mycolicibacterium holsaticum DSM 44478 = JCM 12374]UNC11247.1 hypothetical protein H5U41_08040 [Mycolicibacterium holsaticum DSM 44478 = JCM 12374]
MAGRIRRARESRRERRASKAGARPDNRLAVADEALLAEHHAADMNVIIQVTWVYEHPIDIDALRRFHYHLGQGLLGRRIERPALSMARHRWVVDRGPSDIDIAENPRPRAELSDWVDERSQLLIDPENGPGWHLGVVPLTDGSTGISLVLSHNLIDGLGLALVIVEAVLGKTRDLGYPLPQSRTRARAVLQDARQTARDLPELARALTTGARLAREQARAQPRKERPRRPARTVAVRGDDEIVLVPAITIYIDLDDWDACAARLGGASHTMAAAFAAKFGERIGRRRADDGAVTLQIPISDRTEEDTRAMALSYARVTVDPTPVTTDLSDIRATIKQTLRTLKETPDKSKQLLWLPSFTPDRALKRMVARMPADPDQPVFCSYLGDLHSLIGCPAGTVAEYENARGTGQRESRRFLEQIGGRMIILSGRINGKIFISVGAYQPGGENTKPALRELAKRTMADFGLTGHID